MSNGSRERDLVLAPNEFAFISDQTKGNINTYVGPFKTSLANTDQPAVFDRVTKRFEDCSLEDSIQLFAVAPEGWYLALKNPGAGGTPADHPKTGTVSSFPELVVGHKVNIPGPISFALWPGQMVRVIKGHHMRSNQYLVVRVYDEQSAKDNWDKAVIKPRKGSGDAADEPAAVVAEGRDALTMGKLLIIKGTDVSFYIPPIGIEVVADGNHYVREAVTLERLEYCILLEENGNKRFIPGPAVVFPEPTETFVERKGHRKFKAIELNELSGIYVKVIAPYREGDRDYEVGEELFITGREQMIYFPRPEHALIKYTGRALHYAVAIPEGEGRYVLNRKTGKIELVCGPRMLLPDPRQQVIVRRVLTPPQVELWYPGNQEALEVNLKLRRLLESTKSDTLLEQRGRGAPAAAPAAKTESAADAFAGDDFSRKTQFTPPRTITLDTKYDGAVGISVWTGYAIQVVSKTGSRRVVVGPRAVLLTYDENLEGMELSTGTPKRDDKTIRTAYLRVLHNKVSDLVEVETSDICKVHIRLSYRVNFEGEPDRWLNVENYVKFLTDHMRSVIRNAVKGIEVQAFYGDAINIIRDTVLGTADESGSRPGRVFEENGMRIYDVEVLDVSIGDDTIELMLTEAQHAVMQTTLELAEHRRKLGFVEQSEDISRQIARAKSATHQTEMDLNIERMQKRSTVQLTEVETRLATQRADLEGRRTEQEALQQITELELGQRKAVSDLDLGIDQQRLDQQLAALREEVEAVVRKAQAVSPDLVAALQSFSDRALVERVAESMAPLAILGGRSVQDVLVGLLRGTPLERALTSPEPAAEEPASEEDTD